MVTPVPKADAGSPLRDKTRVIVTAGVVLVDQGTPWTIVEVTGAGADAVHGAARRTFATGSRVTTAGGASGPLSPRADHDPPEASVRAFELLRALRKRRAQGKPAYVVFDDATMERLALTLPRDLAAVARVVGIGPAKLEQYGDAIIEAIEEAHEL
jgi:superfamily II DNA helicase RecQ